MDEPQTWRVVREMDDGAERVETFAVRSVETPGKWPWQVLTDDGAAAGLTPRDAVARMARLHMWAVTEILAPGEPTRAELRAQLATATASVQQLRADVELATVHGDEESARAYSMEGELAVLRAQQAPLVALFDEVMAAARAAGLRGAGHEPAEVVAAVRRLGACEGAVVVRDAAMSVADDLAPDGPEASDCEWAHELMHRVAAAVARVREGGE